MKKLNWIREVPTPMSPRRYYICSYYGYCVMVISHILDLLRAAEESVYF